MPNDTARWRDSLKAFFDERGMVVTGNPTLDDLCYIAGRDPRAWRSKSRIDGLADDICNRAEIEPTSTVLEVGCAAGFLAMLVAPRCGNYTGVDLADAPIKVARRLNLPRTQFKRANGESLPFADATFDSVFCCDVFTNFPTAADGLLLIREMLRVVKPGRPVLVGNVPDRATSHDLPRRVAEVAQELEAEYGPLPSIPVGKSPTGNLFSRIKTLILGQKNEAFVTPKIITYEFNRTDFEQVAKDVGAIVTFHPLHPTQLYHGYRFHAVFRSRPA